MSVRRSTVALFSFILLGSVAFSFEDETAGQAGAEGELPAGFAPFEPLVGRWKGQAVPADNPLRGWRESHEWAWAFEGGEPVAMTLTIEGGKVVSTARLTFDPATGSYRLEGADAEGKPIAFVGSRDPKTNALVLDRKGPAGEDRLTIRPNANGIRSDFWFDRKEPGSPQFARLVRANLGREGVNFAAGGAVTDGPKCIVTGGAATITVSAGGSTFAVCCSGCRDEVVADPAKYAAKLKAVMTAPPGGAPSIRTGPGDGSFDSPSPGPAVPSSAPKPKGTPAPPTPATEPPADNPEPAPAPSDAESRRKAASLLRLGEALEKQGKTDGALGFYRRVRDEAPGSPEAKTAEARIKKLAGDD